MRTHIGESGTVDLAIDLHSALSGGDAERYHWYRNISQACPLWTRQQQHYTQHWGPQTTEGRPPTPWRVMSHVLESERGPETTIGQARLFLEFIEGIKSHEQLNSKHLLSEVIPRYGQNLDEVAVWTRFEIRAFERGGTDKDLAETAQVVLRGRRKGRRGVLTPEQRRAIVREAGVWLKVLAEPGGPPESDRSSAWRLALPFLDSAELSYLASIQRLSYWRLPAARILQRREAAFPSGRVDVTTIYENAFGKRAAADLRRKHGPNPGSDPMADAPKWSRSSTG